jgi:hypothetical protein
MLEIVKPPGNPFAEEDNTQLVKLLNYTEMTPQNPFNGPLKA